MMMTRLIPVIAVLAMAVPAMADTKVDAKKLKGGWECDKDGTKIAFDFKDEKKVKCTIKAAGSDVAIEIDCDYTLKDNVLTGTIKSVDKKGSDAQLPPEGTKFSFKIEVGEKKLILSDAKVNDEEHGLVNGEYTKK